MGFRTNKLQISITILNGVDSIIKFLITPGKILNPFSIFKNKANLLYLLINHFLKTGKIYFLIDSLYTKNKKRKSFMAPAAKVENRKNSNKYL